MTRRREQGAVDERVRQRPVPVLGVATTWPASTTVRVLRSDADLRAALQRAARSDQATSNAVSGWSARYEARAPRASVVPSPGGTDRATRSEALADPSTPT